MSHVMRCFRWHPPPRPGPPCSYSQAIRLIDSGRFKDWRGTRAPGMAVSYYALPVRHRLGAASGGGGGGGIWGWWRCVGGGAAGNLFMPSPRKQQAGG